MAMVQKALYGVANKMEVKLNEDAHFSRYHTILLGDWMPKV
jgi:hypothetical protein